MFIGVGQNQIDAINRCLESQQQDFSDDLKTIFNETRDFARLIIADRQLIEFHHRRNSNSNLNNDVFVKPNHFIEECLRSIFESHYKSSNLDDWNSMKNGKSLALISALATFFKRCDMKKCGNIPLEKIPKFLDREQRRLLAKLQRTTPVKKVCVFYSFSSSSIRRSSSDSRSSTQ